MKHSVRKEDVTYIVLPEKRKVVAFIEGTKSVFENFVAENFPHWDPVWYDDPLFKKMKLPDKFVGISTCGPDDAWDEDIGKLIAFDRMKDKLNTSFFKRANMFVEEMEKRLDLFCVRTNAYGARLEKNTNHRKDKIEQVLNKNAEA